MAEQRARPNKGLILEICGSNPRFISSVHHGLYETPLQDFYTNLNLDEALIFEAGSWSLRNSRDAEFRNLIRTERVYDLFNRINNEGFPVLNRNKRLQKWKEKHEQLNPFRGRNLRERLERVDSTDIRELIEKLEQPTKTYVFECQYHDTKMARDGDNQGIEIMRFQKVYPKKGNIVPAFASEIARILGEYPTHYEPVSKPQKTRIPTFFDS